MFPSHPSRLPLFSVRVPGPFDYDGTDVFGSMAAWDLAQQQQQYKKTPQPFQAIAPAPTPYLSMAQHAQQYAGAMTLPPAMQTPAPSRWAQYQDDGETDGDVRQQMEKLKENRKKRMEEASRVQAALREQGAAAAPPPPPGNNDIM